MSFFPNMNESWQRIEMLLERAETVFISTHVNPDGDAIGSEMALARFLDRKGISRRIVNHSQTPEAFTFLDPEETIEFYEDDMIYDTPPNEKDVIVFLDLGRYDRCGRCVDFFEDTSATRIIIDHHPPEPVEADVIAINTNAAATGCLVYDFLMYMDKRLIDRTIARSVLTAIVTDCGYFRYGNTTSTTHLIASSLYEKGASAVDIRKKLETGFPLCRQKLMGLTLGALETRMSGLIAFSHITCDMFEKAGAKREHTDGIIDQIRMISETRLAFLIIQEAEDRFKISFRSGDGVSVNKVAAMLGGGGHPRAAGANLIGSLDFVTRRVLEAAESYLENKLRDKG